MEVNSLDPPKAELNQFFDLINRGQFAEVLNQSSSALESFPKSWKLYNVQGFAKAGLGDLDGALASYQLALEIEPDQPGVYINMAVTLGKKGMIEESISSYDKALEIKPDNPEAYFNQGTTLAENGQLDRAAESFNRAIKVKPEHTKAWFNLGYILRTKLEHDEARKCYETILEIEGDSLDVHLNLGGVYHAQGKLGAALNSFRKSIQLSPNHAGAHNSIGVILQESGDSRGAIENYRLALQFNPNFAEANQNMGTALREIGELDLALEKYQAALLINPNVAQTHYNKGVALFDKGEIAKAKESYDRAIELEPGIAKYYYSRGLAFRFIGSPNAAIDDYKQALKLNPEYTDAFYNLGVCLQEYGLLHDASYNYRKVLTLEKDHAAALNALGSIQILTLDLLESSKNITRAVASRPEFAEAHYNLGTIYQMQGNPEIALQYFEKGYNVSGLSQRKDSQRKVVALKHFGRSGSMFFHSLFDGHREVVTIPGVYVKGWFDKTAWGKVAPNFSNKTWREILTDKLMNIYEPLFDSTSKKNVPGKPFGSTKWLAKESGFLEMGDNRDENFCLDQDHFKGIFLKLLREFEIVDEISCFNLFHEAFDEAFRKPKEAEQKGKKITLYHIHNPTPAEMMTLVQSYENCSSLYIVRHPIQNLESWMLSDWPTDEFGLGVWQNMVGKFGKMIFDLSSPFNKDAKAVRLEDVKSDPQYVMKEVADWLGISNDTALYTSDFCGLKYWGPTSKVTGPISGFDRKAIDQPIGRLFSERDIKVFEVIFWPFAKLFGYTEIRESEFRDKLHALESHLDRPFDFEERLYQELNVNASQLTELLPFKTMHRELRNAWQILEKEGTFLGMMQPLALPRDDPTK